MNPPTAASLARLETARAWIFDMDGTLTVPMHDFDAIRDQLGLPQGKPILEALAAMDPTEAAPKHAQLDDLELDLARGGQAAEGVLAFLQALAARGVAMGVLTRNSRRNALVTLEAAGLLSCFDPRHVLGRDDAPPKPDPAGILRLLSALDTAAGEAVMVGDYRFDLEAGRRAGTSTVYVDVRGGFEFAHLADLSVRSFVELSDLDLGRP